MTDHLGIPLQDKMMIERQWESLAQSGVQIVVESASTTDPMHPVHLCGLGQELYFQYRDSPSTRWEKEMYVSGTKNKKEAKLLAKKKILEQVDRLKLAGTTITIEVPGVA